MSGPAAAGQPAEPAEEWADDRLIHNVPDLLRALNARSVRNVIDLLEDDAWYAGHIFVTDSQVTMLESSIVFPFTLTELWECHEYEDYRFLATSAAAGVLADIDEIEGIAVCFNLFTLDGGPPVTSFAQNDIPEYPWETPSPGLWTVAQLMTRRLGLFDGFVPRVLGPDGDVAPPGMRLSELRARTTPRRFADCPPEWRVNGLPIYS